MKCQAFAVACLFGLCSAPVWSADIPTVRRGAGGPADASGPTITVGGEADETVKPDLAILNLAAVDERPTAAAASLENAKLAANLVTAVKKFGVAAEDIHAGSLELHPQFRERTDPKTNEIVERTFLGYRAVTNYRVDIHNLEQAPKIARQIIESGADTYRGLTFVAGDKDERFDALRAKAIANAMQRAALYARSASLKLGEIVQIVPEGISNTGGPAGESPAEAGEGSQVAVSVPAESVLPPAHARVRVTWQLAPQSAVGCEPDKEQK